jgi:uncharacterized membrane protein YkvA (DUF1232 family)
MLARLKRWARQLKADLTLLALAARHPRVPSSAKWLAAITLAYALSPIDLIPDFIPVLGLLDDLILLPLGIWLSLRLIPAPLLAELRQSAQTTILPPKSKAAAIVIILIWLGAAWLGYQYFATHALANKINVG